MTVSLRGTVYWEKGETIRIRIVSEGFVEIDQKGKRVRHLGRVRYYHIARGRPWPKDCVRGDCDICLRGFKAARRYLVPLDVWDGTAWTRYDVVHLPMYAERALAAVVDEATTEGRNPLGIVVDLTRAGKITWIAEKIIEP